jgi:GH25 family lysozyme M1 (1,4-beta-N-acetylmuramidase)
VRAAAALAALLCVLMLGANPSPGRGASVDRSRHRVAPTALDGYGCTGYGPSQANTRRIRRQNDRVAPALQAPPGYPRGLDISHWNGEVAMKKAAASGIRFIYLKASQGVSFVDSMYTTNVQRARRHGIVTGAYHFFDYTVDGLAQAQHYLSVLATDPGSSTDLPPAVDVECHQALGRADRAYAREQLREFVNEMYRVTGRYVVIYASAHMWRQVIGNDTTFRRNPLWVACWGCEPPIIPAGWTSWTFWQYGVGEIPGLNRVLDGDVYNGNRTSLQAMRSRPMVINEDAELTNDPELKLRLGGFDARDVRYSVDGETWSEWQSWTREGTYRVEADGPTTVYMQPRAHRGALGPVVTDSIVLDQTAPKLVAPKARLTDGVLALGERPVPVQVTWRISDETSGLTEAEVHADCGSGRFRVSNGIDPRPEGGFQADTYLAAGRACVLSARALDAAGNEATIQAKPGFKIRKISEGPKDTITYRGRWIRRSVRRADGGRLRTGRAAGPGESATTVTFRFTGNDVALVSLMGPSRGRARITVDGRSMGIIDLYAPTWSMRHVVFATHLSRGGTHTLKLKVLRQANPASSSTRVDIDAFLVLAKRES